MENKLVSINSSIPSSTQITSLITLWDFLAPKATYLHDGKVEAVSRKHLSDADFIIVCGSNDLQSPQEAIKIYIKYLLKANPNIPIVFSGLGGHGTIPSKILKPSEAEAFYAYASKQIPNANLLIEPSAMNSGQNITKSYELLYEKGLIPKRPVKTILIQSTAAQLRAVLTFKKQYQGDWEYVVSIPSTQVNPHIMSSKEIYFHLMYALRELLTTVNYMNGENPFVEKAEIPLSIQKLAMELFQAITNTEPQPNFIDFCNQSVQIIRETFSQLEKPFLIR